MTEDATRTGPRPVRAEAGDPVEVEFTVNGTPVVLHLPARVTLADALREHLGLTGTHLGCEHGVCGMCTVLVDGQAARACLLFACQLDGAEVVTVEGLGSPDELHPLQESFGRHHALQCGFCTPGFLMSSYDLLSTRPEVTDEELPEELSGVLCRCTGYRNILTAVSEARADHPEGIPGPGDCARRALAGRAGGTPAAAPEGTAPPADRPAPAEITPPEGEPTLSVQVDTALEVPFEQVWRVLDDVELLARCLPGAELTEDLGDGYYAGRARVAVGPIKLAFRGVARIVEHDRATGRLRVLAQGRDTGGAQTQADITLLASPLPAEPSGTTPSGAGSSGAESSGAASTAGSTGDAPAGGASGDGPTGGGSAGDAPSDAGTAGTALRAEASVHLTGRIAQFGRALAGDVSRRMFEQFAESVREAATSGAAPQRPAAAPNALRLVLDTVRRRLKTLTRRR